MPPMSPAPCALVVALVAACGGASDLEHPADLPHQSNADLDWRDQVIYQIMVDRFAERRSEQRLQRRAVACPAGTTAATGRASSITSTTCRRSASPRCGSRRWSRTSRRTPGSPATTATGRRTSCAPTRTSAISTSCASSSTRRTRSGMLVILDVVTNHMGQLFYYDINGNGQPDDYDLRRRLLAHLPADLQRRHPRAVHAPTS